MHVILVPRLESQRIAITIQLLQYGDYTFRPWQNAIVQNMLNDAIQDTLNGYQFTRIDIGKGWLQVSGTTD